MISAILEILKDALDIFTFFFKRKTSPSAQYDQAKDTNAKAIESGDAATVNARLAADLDSLPNSNGNNPK